ASAITPLGTSLPEYASLMAIVRSTGNCRRTTVSRSKPDIPGILRSVNRIFGISRRIERRAEKPSSASCTMYPNSTSASDIDVRTEGSSSTRRIIEGEPGICHLSRYKSEKLLVRVSHGQKSNVGQFGTG